MLTTFMIAVAVLVFLYVMLGVKIVHQGYRYTIEHFGRFVRVGQPGFNYVPPFFYRVAPWWAVPLAWLVIARDVLREVGW